MRSIFRPVTSGWWFTTAYVILILVCPVINDFIKLLNRNGFVCVLLIVWAFYYAVGLAIGDVYLSVVRAVFFYLLGAFIKMHCSKKISKTSFTVYALLCVALWALMSFLFYNSYYIFELPDLFNRKSFFEQIVIFGFKALNTTVALPCFAFCFFRIFENLNIGSRPWINKIASATFGVYLIHDSEFFRTLIWKKIFDVSGVHFKSEYFALTAVCDVFAVFALCCLIDLLRQKFAEPRYLKLYDFLAEKLKAICVK